MKAINPTELQAIPLELQQVKRWVLWKLEHEKKVPICAANLRPRSKKNFGLATFEEAVASLLRHGETENLEGLGFVLGDGFAGVDLDDCRDPATGAIDEWARDLIEGLSSYTEVSPSGEGVKTFLRGKLSAEKPKQGKVSIANARKSGIEIYDRTRYFTVTGRHLENTPTDLESRTAHLDRIYEYVYSQDIIKRVKLFGYVLEEHADRIDLRCPWAEDHSGGDQPRDASLLLKDGKVTGFKCLHASHEDKHLPDVLKFFGLFKSPKDTTDDGLTEDGIALAFTERHQGELLYVATWGRWLRWDENRWKEEKTLAVYNLARLVLRELDTDRSARLRNAIVSLAQDDRSHARLPEDFDRDPFLLNTPAGTVDLRTGELHPHDRAHLITKVTLVSPGGECPLWLDCLRTWTGGDEELIEFLQRLIGYCLTGSVKEEVLALLFGPGANGKTKLVETIRAILGADYAQGIAMETLIVTHGEQHPTDLASLRGIRLAVAMETEEGRRLAEAKVKALTGGDRVRARFMRQDFFEFDPTHKLWVVGNHKPQIGNLDSAMRRRILLIPFEVTIPEEKRDKNLSEKLRAELPGILRWAIEGSVKWCERGLEVPKRVRAASEDYFSDQDVVAQWLEERIEKRGDSRVPKQDVWADWCIWAEARNIFSRNNQWLTDELRRRVPGIGEEKSGKRFWVGIRVRNLAGEM